MGPGSETSYYVSHRSFHVGLEVSSQTTSFLMLCDCNWDLSEKKKCLQEPMFCRGWRTKAMWKVWDGFFRRQKGRQEKRSFESERVHRVMSFFFFFLQKIFQSIPQTRLSVPLHLVDHFLHDCCSSWAWTKEILYLFIKTNRHYPL